LMLKTWPSSYFLVKRRKFKQKTKIYNPKKSIFIP
jgi:hypothetical protein